MRLKQAVLSVMDRDQLKRATDELDIDGVDRRSREDMAAALSRKHRATPEFLLQLLSEAQVKDVCELVGVSAIGRRAALIESLLANDKEGARNDALQEKDRAEAGGEPIGANAGRTASRRTSEKKVTRYTYDDIQEPRTPETGHTSLLPAEEQTVTLPMDNGWSKAIKVGKLPEGDARPVVVDMDPAADPVLFWAGKRNRREVPVLPLQRNEIVSESRIAQIIERARRAAEEKSGAARQGHLFADLEKTLRESDRSKRVEFYTHEQGWKNKLICGDSLHAMESLLHYENMRGKVQMIYIDPPYGIKYDANFQQRIDSSKNGEKESADDILTIKAFRDTWLLGLHTYLSYLQERLYLCRDLLSGSGSIFVQISDENIHLVRTLLDEVFGHSNFMGQIIFTKSSGRGSTYLDNVYDVLLWYAKQRSEAKYNQLYVPYDGGRQAHLYKYLETADGSEIELDKEQIDGSAPIPEGRLFKHDPLSSMGETETGSGVYRFRGKEFRPPLGRHWSLKNPDGLDGLARANRLFVFGKQLRFKRYQNDLPYRQLSDVWEDAQKGTYVPENDYVVQTAAKVIERCILMATGSGDLVFDPTCGSGTTAVTAEKWGRRWITCDTSRIAMWHGSAFCSRRLRYLRHVTVQQNLALSIRTLNIGNLRRSRTASSPSASSWYTSLRSTKMRSASVARSKLPASVAILSKTGRATSFASWAKEKRRGSRTTSK